jgi:hypothetical protein
LTLQETVASSTAFGEAWQAALSEVSQAAWLWIWSVIYGHWDRAANIRDVRRCYHIKALVQMWNPQRKQDKTRARQERWPRPPLLILQPKWPISEFRLLRASPEAQLFITRTEQLWVRYMGLPPSVFPSFASGAAPRMDSLFGWELWRLLSLSWDFPLNLQNTVQENICLAPSVMRFSGSLQRRLGAFFTGSNDRL